MRLEMKQLFVLPTKETNTSALNILTLHVVIASPKGVAISFLLGLLRRSAPRNDKLLVAFVLVQIQVRLTLITFYSAPENLTAAFRTNIAGFFILNPFFSTHLSPVRNGPQNNLFANRHGKLFDIQTRKFIALMASGVTFLSCALPDLTLSAVHKLFIR
jgi:hypothetical protein